MRGGEGRERGRKGEGQGMERKGRREEREGNEVEKERGLGKDGGKGGERKEKRGMKIVQKVQIHTETKCGANCTRIKTLTSLSCTFLKTCTYEHKLASVDESSEGPLSALHCS